MPSEDNETSPGLEIDADFTRQKHEWAIRRVVWIFLYGLLACVPLGLVGDGPFSSRTLESDDGSLRFHYEKFARNRAPGTLRATVRAASDTVAISLDSQYLRELALEQVRPAPIATIAGGQSHTFVFLARSGKPLQVAFDYRPQSPGTLNGWIAVDDGAHVPFGQFVYP